MSKSEYEAFKKVLDTNKKEIKNNAKKAQAVLVMAGIFTENGTLKKVYRNICIQQSLD
jgi:hypothetical protein